MNDPLRDNRIFPEEMHQKQSVTPTKKHSYSLLWNILFVCVILALLWFGYTHYKKQSQKPENNSVYQEQFTHFQAVQDAAPRLDTQTREEKIEVFFGSN